MPTINLDHERLESGLGYDHDTTLLQRRYRVEGQTERLVVTRYFSDTLLEVDGWLDTQRQEQDAEAQFVADHPLPEEGP